MSTKKLETLMSKFYSKVNPNDCWNYECQKDIAIESVKFYIECLEDMDDVDVLEYSDHPPYEFTLNNVYYDLYEIISQLDDPYKWQTTPDYFGGIHAYYTGDKGLICSVELGKDGVAAFEYLRPDSLELVRVMFSHEVPLAFKILDMKAIFNGR